MSEEVEQSNPFELSLVDQMLQLGDSSVGHKLEGRRGEGWEIVKVRNGRGKRKGNG
jgi:hypothetical protein